MSATKDAKEFPLSMLGHRTQDTGHRTTDSKFHQRQKQNEEEIEKVTQSERLLWNPSRKGSCHVKFIPAKSRSNPFLEMQKLRVGKH